MDLPKIFTWVFACISAVAGLLYCEEWYRKKYPKKGGDAVIAKPKTSPDQNKLQSFAAFLMVGSAVVFTISGCLWVTGLENRISIAEKNKRIANPNLHCSLVHGAIAPPFETTPVSVFYQLKVVNSGSPSIAWRWRLAITLTTGQVIELDAPEHPMNETFVNPATKQLTIQFDNSTYLPNLLLENPIATGAGKVGWIVFRVDTATQEDLQRIGNRFVLKFEDCEGNVTSITNVLTQKGGVLL
jgi:hypothetical protein